MKGGVGVLGGTFNPIHLGHLRAGEEVAEALGLARVLFVPAAQPPHKSGSDDDPIAPAADRLAWARLAVRDNPRFEVDPIEIERGGASYAVETLAALGERLGEPPVFVIGRDAFLEIGDWREPARLFELAHFAVISRPPYAGPTGPDGRAGDLGSWLPEIVRGDVELAADGTSGRHASGTSVRLVEIRALDVSASDIRARIRAGRSVRYLLPETAREEILKSGIYGERPSSE